MKIKLQTLLKHKLQWLVLLAALLGVSSTASAFKVYLKPSSSWKSDGARFAVYFFDSGDGWTNMTEIGSTGYYYADVDDKYTTIIFCRMNGSKSENNWDNRYNQSGDISKANASGNVYKDDATSNWNSCSKSGTVGDITGDAEIEENTDGSYSVTSGGSSYSWNSTNTTNVSVKSGGSTASATLKGGSTAGGSADIFVTYTKNSNYYVHYKNITVIAGCTTPTKSQYTMASGQSVTYDGSAHAPSITINDGAGSVAKIYGSTNGGSTWSDYGTAGPINVGTYNIKVDVNAGGSYCAASGIILDNTYSITPANRTISITNTNIKCGTGTYTLTSEATPNDEGTKTYSISGTSSIASISGTTLTLTGAGTFTVQVNITASGNYAAASGTKEFTVTLPTLSTSAATSISYTSATLNGSVSNVTCTPSASGFEYKKGSDAYTSVAAASATGSISKEISGLTPGTTYTFRTYTVVNGVTKYSSTRTFTTTSCSAPVISSSSLGAQSKCKDADGTAMTVTASGGVGTLTYTWYKKNDTTPSGGTQVQSSTSNSYTPPTGTVGTLYYYCIVSSASPCASSTVNSGISGAVEIKAKPTLTISPAGTIYNYMPLTVSSDMDVATWSWAGSANLIDGYFTSELTRTATFKGEIKNQETTRAVTFTATGTNGCNGTVVQDITKDTESCTQ